MTNEAIEYIKLKCVKNGYMDKTRAQFCTKDRTYHGRWQAHKRTFIIASDIDSSHRFTYPSEWFILIRELCEQYNMLTDYLELDEQKP